MRKKNKIAHYSLLDAFGWCMRNIDATERRRHRRECKANRVGRMQMNAFLRISLQQQGTLRHC